MNTISSNLPPHRPLATIFVQPGELKGDGAGRIIQFERVLNLLWNEYTLIPDYVWYGADLFQDIGAAIIQCNKPKTRFVYEREGDIKAGPTKWLYFSKFSITTSKAIELFTHPDLGEGIIIFAEKIKHWGDLVGFPDQDVIPKCTMRNS